ncbi:hypothetical protein MtrunA17_Chr5g0414021 [Medicago truncatula]|uniref:Uncharacterized protein n=1 Tax=Medicago truncatula TaxID=3880 RepID=A0A396HP37_MEDTR|nr:hypothetical protein MtrunA17_Chr5g0414021 [Medicago truncatula]
MFHIYKQVRHILNNHRKLREVIDLEMTRNSYSIQSIFIFANLASRCVRTERNEWHSMVDCVKDIQMTIYASSKGGLGMAMNCLRLIK